MAFIQATFCAETLGLQMKLNAVIPDKCACGCNKKPRHKVLYLLHGMSDDCSMWGRHSRVESYVQGLPLVVIMPEVHRSFYADMVHGGRYWRFISEELPAVAENFFPVSTRRSDTYVAGLSMGGYGALKLALAHPDRFRACAAYSSAVDPVALMTRGSAEMQAEYRDIFGSAEVFTGSDNDLRALARKALDATSKPEILQLCGSDDFLIDQNREFGRFMDDLGWPGFRYEESPGVHDWNYWDAALRRTLDLWFAK